MAKKFEDPVENRCQCLAGNEKIGSPQELLPLLLLQSQTRESTEAPTGLENEITGSPMSPDLSPSSPGDTEAKFASSHVTSNPSNLTQLVIEDSVSRRANSIPDSFLLSPSPVGTSTKNAALKLLPPFGICHSSRAKSAGGSPVGSGSTFWTQKSDNTGDESLATAALNQNCSGGTKQRDRINQCQDNACSLHVSLPLLSAKKCVSTTNLSRIEERLYPNEKIRANSLGPTPSGSNDIHSTLAPVGIGGPSALSATGCRNLSSASVNVSITHRPSIPPPVSKFYSVSKLVEEGENMVLKRNKKSFQTKVYNFLERPSGKLCITYHISVFVMVISGILLGIVSNLDDKEDRMNSVIVISEVFLLCFFGAEYVVRVWSSGCRVKYRGFKGRLRFARKPIAFIDLFIILASSIALLSGSDNRIFAGATIRGIRFLQMLRMLHVDRKGGSWRLLSSVVYIHRQELITTLYIGFLCLIFASYLVYLFEFNAFKHPSFFSDTVDEMSAPDRGSSPVNHVRRNVLEMPATNRCVCSPQGADVSGFENSAMPKNSAGSPEKTAFASYADALWWGITTVTTIGYGDIVPQTWMGKVIASIFSVFAISFFALPAGILGSGFALKVQQKQRQKHFSRKIPAAASLIQCCWRCYSVHPKVELEIAWKVFTKGRVGLKDPTDPQRFDSFKENALSGVLSPNGCWKTSSGKRESTFDFLKRNIETGSIKLRASMSSISDFNRKGSCIGSAKYSSNGDPEEVDDTYAYNTGAGAQLNHINHQLQTQTSISAAATASSATTVPPKRLPVISVDKSCETGRPSDLQATQYDFENFYPDDLAYNESDTDTPTIPKLTTSHKNAIRLVRKLQFLVAKRKFQNCRQPYDVRDVMEQYSQGHISMMVRIKELQRRLDQNLGRVGPQYDSAYQDGRYKNCAIARLSRLESQMTNLSIRVEECLLILRRQQRDQREQQSEASKKKKKQQSPHLGSSSPCYKRKSGSGFKSDSNEKLAQTNSRLTITDTVDQ